MDSDERVTSCDILFFALLVQPGWHRWGHLVWARDGQLAVDIRTGETGGAPAFYGLQVADKFRLQVDAQGLPEQADGAARKGDVVARLDAVQVFKEKATAGKTALLVVLRFQQEQGTLHERSIDKGFALL